MSWTPSRQFRTKDANSWVEYGYFTLGSVGTASVNTYLKTIQSITLAYSASPWVCGNLRASRTISSGAVTVTDSAGGLNSGIEVAYSFRGLM